MRSASGLGLIGHDGDSQFDLMGHVKKHVGKREERVDPIIAKLKEDGAKEIAAIGFCFGVSCSFRSMQQ